MDVLLLQNVDTPSFLTFSLMVVRLYVCRDISGAEPVLLRKFLGWSHTHIHTCRHPNSAVCSRECVHMFSQMPLFVCSTQAR